MLALARALAPARRMGLNRRVTASTAHFQTFARTPSGASARVNNNNANTNNRARQRVGEKA
jgi:hypothetical protein